jgi:hypothetical protein
LYSYGAHWSRYRIVVADRIGKEGDLTGSSVIVASLVMEKRLRTARRIDRLTLLSGTFGFPNADLLVYGLLRKV